LTCVPGQVRIPRLSAAHILPGAKARASLRGRQSVNQGVNFRLLSLIGQVGVMMVVFILLGLVVGQWIDGRLGTSPTFTLGLMMLGIGAGGWSIARMVKWALESTAQETTKHEQ